MTTQPALTSTAMIEKVHASRDAAAQWLVDRIGSDGHPAGDTPLLETRVPLTLSLAGQGDTAARVLQWYARNADRDLLEGNGERYAPYFLALLAHGAAVLSRYDTARWLCDELRAWHAPCGAPWSRTRRGCGEVELVPACQVAMTYLAAGRTDDAVRIADLMVAAWDAQPEPDERLYLIADGDGRLVLDVPSGLDDAARGYYVLERDGHAQHFFTGGIAAAMLVQTAWATRDNRYLQAARPYLSFAFGQTHQFEVYQCCKTAWGAAYVAAATGDAEAAEWLHRMAEWFIGEQQADGSWQDPNFAGDASAVSLITSEFGQHMWSIGFGLGHLGTSR